ncbi:MAG TPA: hypothetical protein VES03_01435 [Motilibacterales bacterium]|nr:hypothetical protein [Motilibacterales bacterium]
MDLTAQCLREALLHVDLHGWDSDVGGQLLDHVRRSVVVPVVRRSGLRGPAADQAEASGWQAAWDALRRPTARTAENPGGMVWVAVRRAVAAEVVPTRMPSTAAPIGPQAPHLALVAPSGARARWVSLDDLMDSGWHPGEPGPGITGDAGPIVAAIVDGLVEVGWDRTDAADAIALMADHVLRGPAGAATTRWRWVSLRVGVPEWRARRLAGLLLGGPGWPGVLELVVLHGPSVVTDPAVRAAMRSTVVSWQAGPGAWLAGSAGTLEGIA